MNNKSGHIDFDLIGISNHSIPLFKDEVLHLIKNGNIFSGGKRHYQLVKPFLPEDHKWIEISGKMDALTEKYQKEKASIIVFVSGDPFFYGFGNTLQRLLPQSKLRAYPYFNSIQLLCQKTQTNYNELETVSVHGRDWSALDVALIQNKTLIGVLSDAKKSPNIIAERMLQYGFDNYEITVGEALDGIDEHITTHSLFECKKLTFNNLNCVLLKQTEVKSRQFGIEDAKFVSLPNRPNMITKMPIRLSTLHALQLSRAKVMWDIGACTGSISIEAKQHFPHLNMVAFEKRPECKTIIQQNTELFSTPGIEVVIADFFDTDLSRYSIPDTVFVGGHGGRLKELLERINALNPIARIVTNAVTEETDTVFKKVLGALNYELHTTTLQVDGHNKINIHTAVKNKHQ